MEIKQITKDEEIVLKGLNPNPEIFVPTPEIISMFQHFMDLDISKVKNQVKQMELRDSLYDAKRFLNYYYKLHKVPYVKYIKIGGKIIQFIRNIDPFKLPLYGIGKDDIFCGAVIEEITANKPPKPQILFRGIELFKEVTEQTSTSIVHEVTHTQLDSIKGSIKNYYNTEVLSIFNELFHSAILDSDERLLSLNDARRIYEMKILTEEIDEHNKGIKTYTRDYLLDNSKYILSDLKAYSLFIKFYYGSDELKNDILDSIQAVFDGIITVEDLLDHYDITEENIQDEEKLLRYFNRRK